jgi:hypothetical protein
MANGTRAFNSSARYSIIWRAARNPLRSAPCAHSGDTYDSPNHPHVHSGRPRWDRYAGTGALIAGDKAPAADGPMALARDVLIEQLDRAGGGLKRQVKSDDVVHDVRTELKRARATLRILRGALSNDGFHRENGIIRNSARPLTALRDAKVLTQALARLRRPTDAGSTKEFGEQLSRRLQAARLSGLRVLKPKSVADAAADIRALESRIRGLSATRLAHGSISDGVVRAYRVGRKAFARAEREPTDEHLHEWRKQAAYLLNQIAVLNRIGVTCLSKRRKCCHELADWLGEDHDLAILRQTMLEFARVNSAKFKPAAVEMWCKRIDRRRAGLQRKSYRMGCRIYAPKPRRLRRKINRSLPQP